MSTEIDPILAAEQATHENEQRVTERAYALLTAASNDPARTTPSWAQARTEASAALLAESAPAPRARKTSAITQD